MHSLDKLLSGMSLFRDNIGTGLFPVDFWEKILQFTQLVWLAYCARQAPIKLKGCHPTKSFKTKY